MPYPIAEKGSSLFSDSFLLFSRSEPEKRNALLFTAMSPRQDAATPPGQCERHSLLRGSPLAFSSQLTTKRAGAIKTTTKSGTVDLLCRRTGGRESRRQRGTISSQAKITRRKFQQLNPASGTQ